MTEEMTKSNSTFQDASLLFVRLVIAAIFLSAAWAKYVFLQQSPGEIGGVMLSLTWVAMIVEPLGAIALVFGFLTRLAAAGLAIIMVAAIYIARFVYGAAFFTGPSSIGFDYNLLILVGCLVLAAFGAGRWSVDSIRKKQ